MNLVFYAILLLIAYLVGSLCAAIIVSQLFNLPDPRQEGSKNPGATNVLRLAGKQYALYVILGDMLKGVLPVLLAKILGAPMAVVGFTALAAVIGHIYPIFFKFHGGKGVATAMGAMLAIHLFLGILVIATWVIVARLTRYSSLASILSMCLAPLYALVVVRQLEIFPPLFFITMFIVYKHGDNITRLLDGEESKIDFNKFK